MRIAAPEHEIVERGIPRIAIPLRRTALHSTREPHGARDARRLPRIHDMMESHIDETLRERAFHDGIPSVRLRSARRVEHHDGDARIIEERDGL